MKIAISSTGPDPDAQIDLRFGRCKYFVLVEIRIIFKKAILVY
jgi:predicted Fe-Mo cluster-binding NifX family protein